MRRLSLVDGPSIDEPLLCDVTGALPAVRVGERIYAKGMLKGLSPPRNPAERGRRGYARAANQAVAELQVVSNQRLRRDGVGWQGRVLGFAEATRESLSRTISHGLPEDAEEVALLKAMVLGVTADISPESEEAFRRSGGMHIFSVSGLHVGIFGSVAWLILRALGVSRRPAIAVIVVLGGCYALVTGLQSPAVRAAIMMGVFLGGFVIRRQPRLLNSAGLAALVILAFDPHQAFSIGFQLSFAVLVAIGLLDGPMRSMTRRWLSPDPFIPASLVPSWRRRVQAGAQYFADIVTVSMAAFAGSGILLWWYFGTVTPAGLIANCALIPLSWFVMALATLSMLLGFCGLGPLSMACNQINLPMVALVKQAAGLFAALPGGHFEVAPASERFASPEAPVAEIVVFDAGLGCGPQAVRPADGREGVWLIDCGDKPGYGRAVRPWLRRHAGRGLEGFVLTHADKAHVGGSAKLMEDFAIHRTFSGAGFEAFGSVPERPNAAREAVHAGARWQAGPETTIEVIFPPEGLPPQSRADDECVVLLISLGPWRVLSMADSGFKTEKWILRHRPDLRADVLVMGRHGSDFCGLPEFLRGISPRALVASSAPFPESEMIPDALRKELRKGGIALFDQGATGAVEIWRDQQSLILRGFVDGTMLRIDPGY
jgi:competence protein ComEC